LPTFISF